MKVVFALFNLLNRKALAPYGGQVVATPNFTRLAERALTFDRHHVGSLPCMPARRDLMTGRLSFLHRSWGPLEPFDNAFPELLAQAGVYSHLISDHCHYWRDGGATYHTRYDTFEFIRGQEKDAWKAMVQPPWERLREKYHALQFSDQRRDKARNNIINREMSGQDDDDFPSVGCFNAALEFLGTNHAADDWFLQIETFDPHEPFQAPARFRDAYPTNYAGPVLDWPPYARVGEQPDEIAELRANYCAVLALCDAQLGRLLDFFDAHDLWQDTALIVSTDHGFLLGEHDWWAKNRMHCYEEVSHIPLFIHHPVFAAHDGERRQALTQTIDLMPTFMDCFQVPLPAETQGFSLLPVLAADRELREAALFGYFGGAVNLVDGRHSYLPLPRRSGRPGDLSIHGHAVPSEPAVHARGAEGGDPGAGLRLHQGSAAAQGAGHRALTHVSRPWPRYAARQGDGAVRCRSRPRAAAPGSRPGARGAPGSDHGRADGGQRGAA